MRCAIDIPGQMYYHGSNERLSISSGTFAVRALEEASKGKEMRISGGAFRGRKLASFPGTAIRPTPEQVRQAIFNIIGQDLRDKRVMDLFAGTGVLGLEAVSRGAESALLVDMSRQAIAVMEKNVQLLGVDDRVRILRHDLDGSLSALRTAQPETDIVFLDPPYGKGLSLALLEKLDDYPGIEKNGLVIVEHFVKELNDVSFRSLDLYTRREYGQTAVSIFEVSVTGDLTWPTPES